MGGGSRDSLDSAVECFGDVVPSESPGAKEVSCRPFHSAATRYLHAFFGSAKREPKNPGRQVSRKSSARVVRSSGGAPFRTT